MLLFHFLITFLKLYKSYIAQLETALSRGVYVSLPTFVRPTYLFVLFQELIRRCERRVVMGINIRRQQSFVFAAPGKHDSTEHFSASPQYL
jgi:hypothetical protein